MTAATLASGKPQAVPRRSRLFAERYTRRLALSHYENFIVGGLLTPRHLRQDFYNIYAYCRVADDLADEIEDPRESLRRLDQWGRWLEESYRDQPPPHPVFAALHGTIRRHAIPIDPFRQLLVAFRQDQHVRSYQSFAQLREYCRSSADPVGHLVLHLAGVYSPERAALADSVCTGLQLANFCQDVRRDAALGRVYLPVDRLEQFGIAPDAELLSLSQPPQRGREMLAAEVDRAEQFLRAGLPLTREVPPWLARDVALFVGGGLAILAAIRRAGYDVWRSRPVVRPSRQLRLLLSVWLGRGRPR
jgi:squalene synthase HpnC